jgi:hypothetical protein
MKYSNTVKLVREGNYAAEVPVRLVEDDTDWSPYLSLEDAKKLDSVRKALKQGDLGAAEKLARIFELTELNAPSATYLLFREAILERKQVTCKYQGYFREVCPIIIGHTRGQERVLAFQFGGKSASPLPPEGEWKCLDLSKVENAEIREGPWHEGGRHTSTQRCVRHVDVDVNVHVHRVDHIADESAA